MCIYGTTATVQDGALLLEYVNGSNSLRGICKYFIQDPGFPREVLFRANILITSCNLASVTYMISKNNFCIITHPLDNQEVPKHFSIPIFL